MAKGVHDILQGMMLLLVLLNPFLMAVYLLDLIEELDTRTFFLILLRGVAIAFAVFCVFTIGGDFIFRDLFQVRFASFQVFGGVLFLIIGVRFVQVGPGALSQMRGKPGHIAGSIAMPFMVGPGTVSASVVIGARLTLPFAVLAIAAAMALTLGGVFAIKWMHDHVRERNAGLVERYVDFVGRASALLVGTIAVDMIFSGVQLWWTEIQSVSGAY